MRMSSVAAVRSIAFQKMVFACFFIFKILLSVDLVYSMRMSMQNMKKKTADDKKEYAKRILTFFVEYYIIFRIIILTKKE